MAAKDDIREFLTTRRAKITPDQAGLPVYGANRRVTGLRREEVALLAGISVEYYTRLERGSVGSVSDGVLDGLVHALQLDEAERDHLYRLVRTASTSPSRADRSRVPPRGSGCGPTVQRILDQMPMPAYLRNGRFDVLAANDLGRALYSPLYEQADAGRAPQQRPVPVPRPGRPGVLRRLRQGPQRLRRVPARRGRPRPLQQGALRPRRRALHPQRGLPPPLGRPRRPLPPHRPQALPPPARRRPRARLRGLRAPRRPRPAHQHLHRPAGLPLSRSARPARELDRT